MNIKCPHGHRDCPTCKTSELGAEVLALRHLKLIAKYVLNCQNADHLGCACRDRLREAVDMADAK